MNVRCLQHTRSQVTFRLQSDLNPLISFPGEEGQGFGRLSADESMGQTDSFFFFFKIPSFYWKNTLPETHSEFTPEKGLLKGQAKGTGPQCHVKLPSPREIGTALEIG